VVLKVAPELLGRVALNRYPVALGEPQQARRLEVEQDLLAGNDQVASQLRQDLEARGILALNLISSPGSGKTTLLVETIKRLQDRLPVAVIEGDQQTTRDADRIAATGAPAIQINTGKGCHLEARSIREALQLLAVPNGGILFIENVGNLVCPALFDLGERDKVVILSVTEGDDKPAKYPHIFDAASVMVLNKIDLLPYVDFDVQRCLAEALRLKPDLQILQLSARTGEGMEAWLDWLLKRQRA
jgi:hydrogenase nickel incorporation protein HypB